MAKSIEKKEDTEVTQYAEAWGTEDIDNSDILIPKILSMQLTSKLVANGKANFGDFVNSVTGNKLGDITAPVSIIPITHFKTWVRFKKETDKNGSKSLVFDSVVPYTPENSQWEWETEEYRNNQCLNFFVLIAEECKQGACLPYALSFYRTSYNTGKKIITHFKQCEMFKKPPASKVLMLGGEKVSNDDGTWIVSDIVIGRDTTNEELKLAYQWYKTLQKSQKRIDDSDLSEETKKNNITEKMVEEAGF